MEELNRLLQPGENTTWSPPQKFNLQNAEDHDKLAELFERGMITSVVNPIYKIACNLFELEHPELAIDDNQRKEYIESDPRFQDSSYGTWVFYPWLDSLVRFPTPQDYRKLRTYRFKDLVTDEEQKRLDLARVAVFGMSVGGNIAVELVRNAVCGSIIIGDPATPNIPNIGRSRVVMSDMCSNKVDAIAKEISKIDPFMQQFHFPSGITDDTVASLEDLKPSVVCDEVDDMRSSVLLRKFAADNSLPYLTASDVDRSVVLEVLRHDVRRQKLFAGMVSDRQAYELLAKDPPDDKLQQSVFVRSIGLHRLSPRLMESALRIGKDLSGIPQLGSTAIAAAGLVVGNCRAIITGEDVRSGITVYPLDKTSKKQKLRPWTKKLARTLLKSVTG